MFNSPTTKTEIAKWAAQAVVAGNVAAFTKKQVIEHTEFSDDSITVEVGSGVVGYLVASKCRPFTDKAVDATIARYQAWKSKRNDKTSE